MSNGMKITRSLLVALAVLGLLAGRVSWSHAHEPVPGAGTIKLQTATPAQFAELLKRAKGRVVAIDFWATYCLPCRAQFPHTVALHEKYRKQGLAVITMSCDDMEAEKSALTFLQKNKATCINLRAADGSSEETFNAYDIGNGSLPHYKLYDRTGKLRFTFALDPTAKTQFTPQDVEAKVRELLAEK